MAQNEAELICENYLNDKKLAFEQTTIRSSEVYRTDNWSSDYRRFWMPSKTMLDSKDQSFNQFIEIHKSSQHDNDDQSSNDERVSSKSFADRSLPQKMSRNLFLQPEKTRAVDQQYSRKGNLLGSGTTSTRCLCTVVFILLFLCAASILITIGILIGSRPRSPVVLSTTHLNFFFATTSTTTITTSSSTSTTTTTTTSTTRSTTWLTSTTEISYSVWNTTAGGDSTPATNGWGVGSFPSGQAADYAFDNTTATKYVNFGYCYWSGSMLSICGVNTGLYISPKRGSSSLMGIQFCTGNDLPNRDPLTITIEGSNQPSSSLNIGSSWTLIYNGSTGLQMILTRLQCGPIVSVSNNSNWYSSYRVLVTSIRGIEIATQYSELRLMGY